MPMQRLNFNKVSFYGKKWSMLCLPMMLPMRNDASDPATTNTTGIIINVYHRSVRAFANMRNAQIPLCMNFFLFRLALVFFFSRNIAYRQANTRQAQIKLTIP